MKNHLLFLFFLPLASIDTKNDTWTEIDLSDESYKKCNSQNLEPGSARIWQKEAWNIILKTEQNPNSKEHKIAIQISLHAANKIIQEEEEKIKENPKKIKKKWWRFK